MPTTTEVSCPECGGKMWDNRDSKRSPKAPDYKCRDKSCEGVIWPPRETNGNGAAKPAAAATTRQPISLGGPIAGLDDMRETGAPPTDTSVPPQFALAFAKYDLCLAHAVDAAKTYPTANLDIAAVAATLFINVSR